MSVGGIIWIMAAIVLFAVIFTGPNHWGDGVD